MAVNYYPVHLLHYYREHFGFKVGDFPITEEIGARTLALPFYTQLEEKELEYVIETVSKTIKT